MQTVQRSTQQPVLRTHVERLLKSNLKQGHDRIRDVDYSYLSPSSRGHQWQWSIHSCCHAIALAHVDPEQARQELFTLVAGQAEDGFIGHVYHWGMRWGEISRPWAYLQAPGGERLAQSTSIHPPMLAQAVERVGEITRDASFAPRFTGALDRYHNWLAENRAPDDDRLLVIVAPHESGMEHSPAHDQALGPDGNASAWRRGLQRGIDARSGLAGNDGPRELSASRFYVKDAVVNALYADSLATMARLHRAQGNGRVAIAYDDLAAAVTRSIMTKILDRAREGFYSLLGAEELRSAPRTVGTLIPIILDGVSDDVAENVIARHLGNVREFWLRYPVPSVAATEVTFSPRDEKLGWRGQTSVYTNWLLWRGLRRTGFDEAAAQLAASTVDMVARSGLWEFYNPLSGEGMGRKDFGWSALALDMA